MAENRTNVITFKVKTSELNNIKEFAEKENKTVSDFIRDTISNKIKRG